MAKAPEIKTERNKKLVKLKARMTFHNLARLFNISETRAKQIYYRELKKLGLTPPHEKKDYWKGKRLTFQHKKKISNANEGRKHSKQTKEKIRKTMKDHWENKEIEVIHSK